MNMKKNILVMLLVGVSASALVWGGLAWQGQPEPIDRPVKELSWDDLMPEGWQPQSQSVEAPYSSLLPEQDAAEAAMEYMNNVSIAKKTAPVVKSLDGEYVKLPGFIVPLEFESSEITEFLLVPYMGACIHTPPPPANQIVYAQVEKKLKVEDLYDPVWIIGKMEIKAFSSDLADAGYSMSEAVVVPYYSD